MLPPLILTAGRWIEAHHFAAREFVFGFDYRELAGFDRVAHDLAIGEEVLRALVHVFLDGRFDQIVWLSVGLERRLGLGDGRIDLVYDRVKVAAGHLFARAGGRYGAAFLMAENEQHRAMNVINGVLDAAQAHRVGDISGRADDEEVSEALIEN